MLAVEHLSFEVGPGTVTGFLGPNGAGKTTTLRILLGLVAPTSGTATIDGQPYRELPDPPRRVGAVLEASGFHPGRSARVLALAGRPGQPALGDDALRQLVGVPNGPLTLAALVLGVLGMAGELRHGTLPCGPAAWCSPPTA